MPIYEYKCQNCGFSFEIIQKINEKAPRCENAVVSGSVERVCGGKCRKLVSKGSFSLKGSGWHKDGYVKEKKEKKELK
jgi:putative FmdB family regulatory protein